MTEKKDQNVEGEAAAKAWVCYSVAILILALAIAFYIVMAAVRL